jgi:hypothetical protein
MSTELLIQCDDKAPKIPFTELRRKVASSLNACPCTEAGRDADFAFDELGIAVSVTFDENSNPATARVRVFDRARIGHVSEVFKTFITLGWAL